MVPRLHTETLNLNRIDPQHAARREGAAGVSPHSLKG